MEFRASFLLRRSMDNYSNEMQFSHSFDHKIGTGKKYCALYALLLLFRIFIMFDAAWNFFICTVHLGTYCCEFVLSIGWFRFHYAVVLYKSFFAFFSPSYTSTVHQYYDFRKYSNTFWEAEKPSMIFHKEKEPEWPQRNRFVGGKRFRFRLAQTNEIKTE